MSITRRELVEGGLAVGVTLLTAPALGADPPTLPLTPENELGPFYKRGAPNRPTSSCPEMRGSLWW